MEWICADFETLNSKEAIEGNYTYVWLWDIFHKDTRKHINGTDIESFFDYLFEQKSCIIYFHNLKFDGAFILNFLLENGFKLSESKQNGTINTLITDRLIWYTFTVYYAGKRYIFRDSLKKIVGSLRQAAEAFELQIKKGEIDYAKHRGIGYIPTKEEYEYIHNDTEIMSDILQYYYDNGMTSITNASDAMKAYKNIVTDTGYKYNFPTLSKKEDDFIRRSYKGGYCFLKPDKFNLDLQSVYCYDVKSMYPSVMAQMQLPYGLPEHYFGKYKYDEDYPLFIQEVAVDCDLKPNHPPSIQTKTFLSIKLNYLTSTNGTMQQLTLTCLDLVNLVADYDIHEIHYIQGYKFHASNLLFRDYVEHFFELKENSKGAKKQLYKIFLNSLYGKFAMMTERQQALPAFSENGLKYDRTEVEEVPPVYTAVASFITSWARTKLLSAIRENWDNFIYCDTDSMHLLEPPKQSDLYTIGNKLGDFDLEKGTYVNGIPYTDVYMARYLGQKCYILCTKKGEIKKIAGAPDKVKEQINMSNFRINFTSDEDKYPKFRVKNVKGGVVLVPTSFTIKAKDVKITNPTYL